jgi:hypothetical protein
MGERNLAFSCNAKAPPRSRCHCHWVAAAATGSGRAASHQWQVPATLSLLNGSRQGPPLGVSGRLAVAVAAAAGNFELNGSPI